MSYAVAISRSKSAERIGLLRDTVTVLAPVSTPTAHRGERIQYAAWRSVKMNAAPLRGTEGVEADRLTAINTKTFTARRLSINGISEKSLLQYAGEYYNIERIDHLADYAHKAYFTITATRRDTNVSPVELIPGLYMDYSQTFTAVTAAYVTVTNGVLPDPTAKTANEINLLLQVYRGGLRLVYGDPGDNGYTITTATNRINPVLSFAGETVLVTQFREE